MGKLKTYSGGDVIKAQQILEQSILCGYIGLFPLKEDKNGETTKMVKLLKGGRIITVTEEQIKEYRDQGHEVKYDSDLKGYYFK